MPRRRKALTPSTPAINDFLRWELVTDGSSALGDASPPAGTGGVPNLTGADANFLFGWTFNRY